MDTGSFIIESIKQYGDIVMALVFLGVMVQKFKTNGSDIAELKVEVHDLKTQNSEQEIQIALFAQRLERLPQIEDKLDKALGLTS